jgi:predicted pyridoxine 5'-phosphate oxidase superfamily flavin-nucleotide-binding protein
MREIPPEVLRFLSSQHYAIVATVGGDGTPHTACKGIVRVEGEGRVYLLDLYSGTTWRNLATTPRMSITVVDEGRFTGYCLKGSARLANAGDIDPALIEEWRSKISGRITHRIIKNIQGPKKHPRHPEALLPAPRHLIVLEVDDIVDLTPGHIR